MFNRIKSDKRGFTLVELVATVAILAVLVTIAIVGVLANSVKLKEKEYDQNAEAIAVAAQSRLTALKNAGDTDKLAALGVQVDEPDQRFVSTDKTEDMDYILPPFSIDGSLREKDFVIGFSSTTAKVSEVFFFANGLPTDLSTKIEDLRKNKKSDVGYYKAAEDIEVNVQPAGAQLPTPQLSINNFENLQLDIYLPYVRQLPEIKLGFKVMLVGKDELPAEKDEAAKTIYETPTSVQLETGNTYSLILDTPQEYLNSGLPTIANYNTTDLKNNIPTGRFSTWARLTSSYIGDSDLIDSTLKSTLKTPTYDITGGFKLGEDVKAIVKVYAMKTTSTDGIYEQDKMYVTRTASVVFNGWFQSLTERVVYKHSNGTEDKALLADISCGRHLQNLSRLTEMRKHLQSLLPKIIDGKYTYSLGNAYSYIESTTYNYEKFARKYNVCSAVGAYQLMPIDFNTEIWKDITFDPINTVSGFYYFGNYYPIRNINVLSDYYAGLFGYSYKNKIYDVRLVNPTVKSNMPLEVSRDFEMGVGGLIGTDRDSSEINNCQVYLEKINISKDVKNPNYVYAKERRVEGNGYVGGLIGFAEDENIRQCSASCYVGSTESHSYVGGLIGGVTGDSNIKRCYAAGILRGEYVGGILGAYMPDTDYSGDSLTIESCYTAGNIEAAVTSAGGLIGYTEKEQRGYEKSAMRAHKNYCVVIYGEEANADEAKEAEKSAGYIWRNNAKIYGTFDGDNFVWLYTGDDIVAEESIATDYYRILASAAYEEENYNYYVPQKGIEYAHSSLYMAEGYVSGIKEFVTKYSNIEETFDVNTFSSALKTQQDSVLKNNRLQVLEQIRQELISLYYDVNSYVDKGTLVNKLYNNEEIKIDYHFDHMPQGTNKDYDKDCLYVSSHSPRDKSKGDKIDTRRIVTIKDVIQSLIFGGAVPGENESWSYTIKNPANDTALWYIDQLEGMLKDPNKKVTIRYTKADKETDSDGKIKYKGTYTDEYLTYTLDGKGEGIDGDFNALIQKFASFFFSDKNSHDNKYYWPNIGGSEERRGALSELFADIRGFFKEETYYKGSEVLFPRSDIVYSYNDIYHSKDGSSHGAMHSGFNIDKDGNLIDIERDNTIIAHNFDKSTSFSNGDKESSSNLLYDIIKNPDGSVAKKIALRDGYTLDSNNLIYTNSENKNTTLVENFDPLKNFDDSVGHYLIDKNGNPVLKEGYSLDSENNLLNGSTLLVKNFSTSKNIDNSSNYYLLDENGSPVVKTKGEDNFYAMESFKDRVDKDILTMLYSLYHYGDSWQSGYIIQNMNDSLWKKGDSSGNARDIVKFSKDNKSLIEAVDIDSNRVGHVNGKDDIIPLINKIFGSDWNKDRANKLDGGLFGDIFDLLVNDEFEPKDYNRITLLEKYNTIIKDLNTLSIYFDKAVDFYSSNETNKKLMSDLKEDCDNLVWQVEKYSRMSYTGGIEEILAKLSDAVELYKNDSGKLKQEIDLYLNKIQIMLDTDSGHAIYDTETGVLNQLKKFAITEGHFDSDDWYKYSSYNFNSGLYNTVFPYHEKEKKYTGVFPFPLIKGLRPQGMDKRVTEMLIHYGDWLTPDMWATEEYHRDEALSLLIDVDAELQSITKYLTTTGATSQTTGTLKSSIDDAVTNVNTCIETVETVETVISDDTIDVTVRKDSLAQIQGIISGWLDKDGLLSNLSDACNKALHTGHSDTAEALKTQIENNFKPALTDLLEKIKKIIGA